MIDFSEAETQQTGMETIIKDMLEENFSYAENMLSDKVTTFWPKENAQWRSDKCQRTRNFSLCHEKDGGKMNRLQKENQITNPCSWERTKETSKLPSPALNSKRKWSYTTFWRKCDDSMIICPSKSIAPESSIKPFFHVQVLEKIYFLVFFFAVGCT